MAPERLSKDLIAQQAAGRKPAAINAAMIRKLDEKLYLRHPSGNLFNLGDSADLRNMPHPSDRKARRLRIMYFRTLLEMAGNRIEVHLYDGDEHTGTRILEDVRPTYDCDDGTIEIEFREPNGVEEVSPCGATG